MCKTGTTLQTNYLQVRVITQQCMANYICDNLPNFGNVDPNRIEYLTIEMTSLFLCWDKKTQLVNWYANQMNVELT